jgi:hypothetical protein
MRNPYVTPPIRTLRRSQAVPELHHALALGGVG